MTKFEIYADGDNRPVKKLKREYEAINFVSDMRNLARYGCLTLVRSSDEEDPMIWDPQSNLWKPYVDSESQQECCV